MPTLENNWYRRMLFFAIYFIETLLAVFTLSIFPILFVRDLHIDILYYGVAGSLSLLPMACKVFIGPLSDKFPIPFLRGRRRGYIILGGILNAIFIPLLSINPLTFATLFFVIWLFQSLAIATIDIMIDALAVGGTKNIQNLQGRTGASVWIFLGVFLGGGVALAFSGIFDSITLSIGETMNMALLSILGVVAVFAIIPVILIIFLKEAEYSAPERASTREIISRNLKHPFVKWGLVFAFMLNIDGGLLELTLEPYLNDPTYGFNKSVSDVVTAVFMVTLLGVVLGVLGYKFIDKVKKNKLLAIIALIYVGPLIILGVLILNGGITWELFLILFGVFATVSGLSFVTYTAFFFDLSDPKAAGTMVALFLSVSNAGMVLGIALGGLFPIPYFGLIYLVAAVISAARVIPLLKIRMEDIQKTFYEES